jgi:prepilin-type N-terminal cleavage/methylation domain-containing protein
MKSPVKDQKGFTLVELLIALAITAFLAISVWGVYNLFYKQAKGQDVIITAQQNARAAIERLQKELILIGHKVPSGTPAIIQANANSIEFRYVDPIANPVTGFNDLVDVTYEVEADNSLSVKRRLYNADWLTYCTACGDDANKHTVISSVNGPTGLVFSYYDKAGASLGAPVAAGSIASIQTIKVSLTTITPPFVGPGSTLITKTATVETEVRLRNYGVTSGAANTNPPATPTGLQSRLASAGSRFGVCGRLALKWNKGAEPDLAGYVINYTLGSYSKTVRVSISQLTVVGSSYTYTFAPKVNGLLDLQTAPSYGAASNYTYSIQIAAFDNANNTSPFTAAVSGTSTLNDNFADTTVNGTTIYASKPTPVTGLAATSNILTPNKVTLNWSAYDTATNPDIVGFRVYRSSQPFSSYPIIPSGAIKMVATEPGLSGTTVAPSATTFTDSDPSLGGCQTYYYAIAPVNCDTTLIADTPSPAEANITQGTYAQTDYAATCGDGTNACTPGTGFAAVTGSNTQPYDNTPPQWPANPFSARAGWQRVALSFTQPSDSDLARTCIYGSAGNTPPALQTNITAYPLVNGCYQVNTSATPAAVRLYENNGVFPNPSYTPSSSWSFWNNSLSGLTSTPSLANLMTYSYTAVAFDKCGNGSSPAAAQATTTLCGEDPPVCPTMDSTGYCQAAPGKPPAPAAPAVGTQPVSVCANPVTLTWTPVSSDLTQPSREDNPYDLAGYRILRSSDLATWTVLNNSAPLWGNTFDDAGISDGGTYYYKIASTDCPYEKNNPSAAQIISDVNSGYLRTLAMGPAYPGRLDRDQMCVGSGSCTKTAHREVLTGVNVDNSSGNGDNSATPSASYTHTKVTLFLNNTSASTMTVKNLSLSWTNASAILSSVTIGGGRSGMGQYSTAVPSSQTTPVVGNPPYVAAVANIALTPAQIPAGARYVPITFRFLDSAGNPVDERLDTLLVTLSVQNDSTSTQNCPSYLTISQVAEGVFVPGGPVVLGTIQDQPSNPTTGYVVPGPAGLNNTVPSGSNAPVLVGPDVSVNVSSNVASTTLNEVTGTTVSISGVKVYYTVTSKTVTTAPASGYTAVVMNNASGNTWKGAIPANDGQRIWYYVIATDVDGNYSRDPDISAGAYVYDQQPFDPCVVTPSAPTSLSASVSGTTVTLSWSAITTYTSGASINPADTIKYRIFRNGSQVGSDQSGTSYTDSGLTNNLIYNYSVEAVNSCSVPGPRVSALSTNATACVGVTGQANLTVTPTSIYRGQSYTVTIVDCFAASGTYASTIETVNSSPAFLGFSNTANGSGAVFSPTINESGVATGTFPITITTTSNSSDTTKLYTNPSDTITVFYQYATPSARTVIVGVDPCSNTPKAPTGLTGTVPASGSTANISWSAVTQNTDNTAIGDLAGYRVYEKACKNGTGPNCTGADLIFDWSLTTSVGSGTTSASINLNSGKTNKTTYYFKITAIDSCGTPNESAYSNTWNTP